jgi:hypothetical protein
MGTLDFMAPEQAAGAKKVDRRGDIYSLGCTLYFLLTGRAPFSGAEHDTAAAKILAHVQQPPPPVTNFRRDIPPPVARCVERMLAKDPADRFATMAQVAGKLTPHAAGSDLARLLRHGVPQAETVSWLDRVITWRDVWWATSRACGFCFGRWTRRRLPKTQPLRQTGFLSPLGVFALALGAFVFLTGSISCEALPSGAGPSSSPPSFYVITE